MTRTRLIDIGLPLVLAVAALVEVAAGSDIDAPWPIVGVFALGTTLPLLWRRDAPLVVLVFTLACITIPDATYEIANNASAPFAGVLVAVYASGAYTSRRDGRLAAGVIAVMVVVTAVAIGEDVIGDIVFIGGILFAVWGAATVVRSRQELAGALAERTVELEHEREETAKLAVAEERARIARELHDVVAHSVSMMVVQAGAERRALGAERPETAAVLGTIEDTGRAAMAELRRLLGLLRRSDDELALAPQPSLSHLDDLVEQVREAGMPVDLRIEGEPRPIAAGHRPVRLPHRPGGADQRAQARRPGPGPGERALRRPASWRSRSPTTERMPPPATSWPAATGWSGMRERVALIGGDLDAGRRRGGGYAVRARLPLAGDAP